MADFADRPYAAVLFDLDGTILDTYDLIIDSFHHAAREVFGHDLPDARFCESMGRPLADQMWLYTSDPHVHEQLLVSYRAFNHRIHDAYVHPYDGIPEVIEALYEAGYPLGVVTSKLHKLAAHGLELFGLSRYMGVIIGADDCTAPKPDPAPVFAAAGALGVDARDCLFIGDSPYDIRAGVDAGAATLAVSWGVFPEGVAAAEGADFECDKPAEILEVALSDGEEL